MQITIKAKKLDLTPALRQYAEEKVDKLTRHYDRILTCRIDLERLPRHQKGEVFRAEVNLDVPKKKVLRAEENASDIYAAIDLVVPKLERQLRRFKEIKRQRSKKPKFFPVKAIASLINRRRNDRDEPRIVERKRFTTVKPMTESEAMARLDEHKRDFFLFWNADTDRFAVIYKREDGNFNIVEPDLK